MFHHTSEGPDSRTHLNGEEFKHAFKTICKGVLNSHLFKHVLRVITFKCCPELGPFFVSSLVPETSTVP